MQLWRIKIYDKQSYLSFPLVWFVMETDCEKADEVDKEDAILWLNHSSLGTTDTCGDEEQLEERGSIYPTHVW